MADDGIQKWLQDMDKIAVKLTDNNPQVFEVGESGTLLVEDANTISGLDDFISIESVKPGIWKATWDGQNDASDTIFTWISEGPLDLENLPTTENCPEPPFSDEELTEWEKVSSFSVDSGKFTLVCKDMMESWTEIFGDEREAIEAAQDPFSARMGYQGVLPGGYFTCGNDGGYVVQVHHFDDEIVQLAVREYRDGM